MPYDWKSELCGCLRSTRDRFAEYLHENYPDRDDDISDEDRSDLEAFCDAYNNMVSEFCYNAEIPTLELELRPTKEWLLHIRYPDVYPYPDEDSPSGP